MQHTSRHLSLTPLPISPFSTEQVKLYHYTTYAGFLGIIKSTKLWATNIHYLNDFEEFKHGLGIAKRIAIRRASVATSQDKPLFDRLASVVEQYEKVHLFVSSFTENGDILSQWRGYSSNGGVSLGFAFPDLQRIAGKNGFRLIKCIYDDHEKEVIAEEFIDDALTRFARTNGSPQSLDNIAYSYMGLYIPVATAFKHKAFAEESEWRLVSHMISQNDPRIDVRATSTMLIPYFEVDLNLDTDPMGLRKIGLERLIVGPSREQSNVSNAAGIACARHGIYLGDIRHSFAPYRTL